MVRATKNPMINNSKIMIKMVYEEPLMKVIEVKLAGSCLTVSNGSLSTPSGENMSGFGSYESWD
jgi:hypothetical protein